MQGSDLGSFYKPMSIGFIAIQNCAHFPDNLNLAAQFVSLVPILGVQGPYLVPIILKSGSLFGPYFKAQRYLKNVWAVLMIQIVFACRQFQQTKNALLLV